MNDKSVLIIGNSDGIGLALTRRLLDLGWTVHGLSKRDTCVKHSSYSHAIVDVTSREFPDILSDQTRSVPDLCVYCAGIGEELDFEKLDRERLTFEVNLMGAVKTIEVLLPVLLTKGSGHLIVLSSIADALISQEAPSYAASKAGLSAFLEGMAMATRGTGVYITNVRFGFVKTKMAKGERVPLMMTTDQAVNHILRCMEKRPIRYTRPRTMGALVCLLSWLTRLRM